MAANEFNFLAWCAWLNAKRDIEQGYALVYVDEWRHDVTVSTELVDRIRSKSAEIWLVANPRAEASDGT